MFHGGSNELLVYFLLRSGGFTQHLISSESLKDSDFFPCLIMVSEHAVSKTSMKEKEQAGGWKEMLLLTRVTNGLIIFIHIPSVLNLSAEEARQHILSVYSER